MSWLFCWLLVSLAGLNDCSIYCSLSDKDGYSLVLSTPYQPHLE